MGGCFPARGIPAPRTLRARFLSIWRLGVFSSPGRFSNSNLRSECQSIINEVCSLTRTRGGFIVQLYYVISLRSSLEVLLDHIFYVNDRVIYADLVPAKS